MLAILGKIPQKRYSWISTSNFQSKFPDFSLIFVNFSNSLTFPWLENLCKNFPDFQTWWEPCSKRVHTKTSTKFQAFSRVKQFFSNRICKLFSDSLTEMQINPFFHYLQQSQTGKPLPRLSPKLVTQFTIQC